MREIKAEIITEEVKKMCISANYFLNNDVYCAMEKALETEVSPIVGSEKQSEDLVKYLLSEFFLLLITTLSSSFKFQIHPAYSLLIMEFDFLF